MSQTEQSDKVRQIVVAVTTAGAAAAAFVGSGVFGTTPVKDAAGHAFAADATVLAPAGFAFSIWSPIYLGLVAYAIWQAVPAQRAKPVHRTVGYGIAASALLNAVWIACVQAWRIAESFVIIVLLLGVLLVTFVRVCRRRGRGSIAQIVLVDGTVGLYLGWVTVAAAANLAAWLASAGVSEWKTAPGTPCRVHALRRRPYRVVGGVAGRAMGTDSRDGVGIGVDRRRATDGCSECTCHRVDGDRHRRGARGRHGLAAPSARQRTVRGMVCQPSAPSGTTGLGVPDCTSPLTSIARAVITWFPGFASQS